jgi:hypothetical protein
MYSNAQENRIELSLQQDLRLLTVGDGKGNHPVTLNLISKLEVPFYNFSTSHFSAYTSIEYADLREDNYQRYALGVAYIIDKLSGRFGAGAYVDFGRIYRESDGFYSYSVSGELSYKLSDRFKLICTQQLTHRRDLKVRYDTREYVISGFFGIKYRF